jgi:COMPASS component SDC1
MSSSTTPAGGNPDDRQHNNGTTPGMAGADSANTNVTGGAGSSQVVAGGAPARVFMNEKIVPYLLEGMKAVTRDQYGQFFSITYWNL